MLKCLLILPTGFYNFQDQLERALGEKGYQVACINDEIPGSTAIKVLSKIGLISINRKLSLNYFRRALQDMETGYYDLVIIIRGRGLSKESLDVIRRYSDNIVGYNFDSFAFNPSPLDWLSGCDYYCTFDPDDASRYNLPLVHLFADASWNQSMVLQEKIYDVSCIMKAHSSRLDYVWSFISRFPQLTHFTYLYVPNIFALLLLLIRSPILCFRLWQFMHFSPVSPLEYEQILRSSNTTIDYAHDMQSGITKRCFEALAAGVSIITNNTEVRTIDVSVVPNFMIVSLERLKSETCSEIPPFCLLPGVPYTRYAGDFLNDLIEGEVK
jgi:hypothetical protein